MKYEHRIFMLLLLAMIIASFLLYANSLMGGYVLDDHSVIRNRPELLSLRNLPDIFFMSWHNGGQFVNYRPLTLTTFALNIYFSENPVFMRAVNIIIHALNSLLLLYLVKKFASNKTAYLASILFLFLPIHGEVVASIVWRSYSMGTLFSLIALYYFFEKKYLVSAIGVMLAIFSAESFLVIGLIVGILILIETKNFKKALKPALYYVPILPIYAVFYAVFRYVSYGTNYILGNNAVAGPVLSPLAYLPVKERIFTGFLHLFMYLRKTVYPSDLSVSYAYNQIPAVSNIFHSYGAILGVLFFAGIITIIFYGGKSVKIAGVMFLAAYAIISNIFFISAGTMADRYWYLPSVGLVILIALGLEKVMQRWKILVTPSYVTIGIALVWYSQVLTNQNRFWLHNRTLFLQTASISPNSAWARDAVATVYFFDKDYVNARKETEAALLIYPDYSAPLTTLGRLDWKDGRYKEAIANLEKALKNISPYPASSLYFQQVYRWLAFLNLQIGNNQEAALWMKKSTSIPLTEDMHPNKRIYDLERELRQFMKYYSNRNPSSYSKEDKRLIDEKAFFVRDYY